VDVNGGGRRNLEETDCK